MCSCVCVHCACECTSISINRNTQTDRQTHILTKHTLIQEVLITNNIPARNTQRDRQIQTYILTEHPLVREVFHHEPYPGWEHTDEDVEIEEERGPRGGLMFRDTCNDGDVDLGIAVGKEVCS